jgi:two-component system LytT family sensor kinase
MNGQWYTRRWVTVALHVLAWAIFFTLPFLLRPVRGDGRGITVTGLIYLVSVNNVLRVLLFYSNLYFLIPTLMYSRKYLQYFVVLLVFFAFMFVVDRFFFSVFLPGSEYRIANFFAFNLPTFVFLIIASAALRGIRDQIRENNRIKELETENLKTELSLLRSQVSPHFMFNVLNNMVALARKKSDILEPSLIKLSQLLRYMLYETDEDKVLLENEVNYLQSYIDLQQQRFGKNVKIVANLPPVIGSYSIEPMLLIPFVENAFKHGTGLIDSAEILIELAVENDVLKFSVRNKYAEAANEPKDKTSGIGLANVKRRLNLLYMNNHILDINKSNGWFTASLHLNLH